MRRSVVVGLGCAALLSSCTINKDIMFKTPTDYQFEQWVDSTTNEFKIQPNDYIEMRLFANDGFELIDLVGALDNDRGRNIRQMTFRYLVEVDGQVKLPILGRVPLSNLTVRQAEFYLEERYVAYYNRPFVQLAVTNRRVVVFPGGGADAKVIPLDNNGTTLLEVLAQAGGLDRRGNASKVKLFRKKPDGERAVYRFDLSDISGLPYGDMVMQGDDVLYVQPNPEIAREVLYDLTPLITLLTTTVLVIGLVKALEQ